MAGWGVTGLASLRHLRSESVRVEQQSTNDLHSISAHLTIAIASLGSA